MAAPDLAEARGLTATLLREAVDDTDEAPWMTMPEFQALVIALLAGILRLHSRRRRLGWHISTELGVSMPKPEGGALTLGPDLFVVEADEALRTSWDIPAEGKPPRFVLEVVTQDSAERDTSPTQKVGYYAAMGVEEYAIYWPYRGDGGSRLFGHRRDAAGAWSPWSTDERGVLRSRALGGLGLAAAEPPWLRVVDEAGTWLPSPEEEADARLLADARAEREAARAEREARDRQQAEERAEAEAQRAADAEAEVARLRALLERRGS